MLMTQHQNFLQTHFEEPHLKQKQADQLAGDIKFGRAAIAIAFLLPVHKK
jgi:hypothetical protein